MLSGVKRNIMTVQPLIRMLPSVYLHSRVCPTLSIIPVYLLLPLLNKRTQQLYLLEVLDFFVFQVTYGGYLDIHRPLDAASATFMHAPPILERIGNQVMRGYCSDCLVPVPYFHRIEIDFQHIAIGIVFGHLDPVTHAYHIIGRHLYTGYKSHDGVFENQQKNS